MAEKAKRLRAGKMPRCFVCGCDDFEEHEVLWKDLILAWELAPAEIQYISQQQGLCCTQCGANLRSIVLAKAMMSVYGYNGLFTDFVTTQIAQDLKILEINEAGTLHPLLASLPGLCSMSYPEINMMNTGLPSQSFDLVVHSDTLEHVPDPLRALMECSRILKSGGACCFTVPIVVGRQSRCRKGLPPSFHGVPGQNKGDYLVYTEFGSDVWTLVLEAGFKRCVMEAVEYPAAVAVTAVSERSEEMTKIPEGPIERYAPWLDLPEVAFEHWHRYLLAAQFVAGKTVLDVACGEGYGSWLLADLADKVFGVDIDEQTIQHASSKYVKENLSFLTGSAVQIPIPGEDLFDVIVSFETIEHLNGMDQASFLREVSRLLRPDGIFIVSTPDKAVLGHLNNRFHLNELYLPEFNALLSPHFSNIDLYGQQIYPVSYWWSLNGECQLFKQFGMEPAEGGFRTSPSPAEPMYIIAICSNASVAKKYVSVLVDLSQVLFRRRDRAIADKTVEIAQRDAEIAQRDAEIAQRDAEIAQRDAEIARRDAEITAMRLSRSWRITAPLRAIAAKLRGRELVM